MAFIAFSFRLQDSLFGEVPGGTYPIVRTAIVSLIETSESGPMSKINSGVISPLKLP
jgi:hypothetical protein